MSTAPHRNSSLTSTPRSVKFPKAATVDRMADLAVIMVLVLGMVDLEEVMDLGMDSRFPTSLRHLLHLDFHTELLENNLKFFYYVNRPRANEANRETKPNRIEGKKNQFIRGKQNV